MITIKTKNKLISLLAATKPFKNNQTFIYQDHISIDNTVKDWIRRLIYLTKNKFQNISEIFVDDLIGFNALNKFIKSTKIRT